MPCICYLQLKLVKIEEMKASVSFHRYSSSILASSSLVEIVCEQPTEKPIQIHIEALNYLGEYVYISDM
jgi:hypothetical protein